jgi:hypothetical protein
VHREGEGNSTRVRNGGIWHHVFIYELLTPL